MKKAFGIALVVAAVLFGVMLFVPIPFSQQFADCCDQFSRTAAYGFPFTFRATYSGGFTGVGTVTFSLLSLMVDVLVIFVLTFLIVSIVSALSSKKKSKK